MKKSIIALLAVIMLFIFTACDKKDIINDSVPATIDDVDNFEHEYKDEIYEDENYSLTLPHGWEKDDKQSTENTVVFKDDIFKSILFTKHEKSKYNEFNDSAKKIYMSPYKNFFGFESKDITVDGNEALEMLYWSDEDEEIRYAQYWIDTPDFLYSISFTLYDEEDPDSLINRVVDSIKFD